jgi:hypothetical protein
MCAPIGSNGALRSSLLRDPISLRPGLYRVTYLYDTRPISEFRPEEHIGIVEQAIFQADDDKLGSFESVLEQFTDMLGMREIQGSVHFIQDIHGRWLELEQRHDEGQGDEGSMK